MLLATQGMASVINKAILEKEPKKVPFIIQRLTGAERKRNSSDPYTALAGSVKLKEMMQRCHAKIHTHHMLDILQGGAKSKKSQKSLTKIDASSSVCNI